MEDLRKPTKEFLPGIGGNPAAASAILKKKTPRDGGLFASALG